MNQQKIGLQVINPNLYPDPNRITHADLYKYSSLDEAKIQLSYKNYYRSARYIGKNNLLKGGILLGCLILKPFIDNAAHRYIFGENGIFYNFLETGGQFLKMYSSINSHDYSYNREFQRMMYLRETPHGDDPLQNVTDQQLIDLGVKLEPQGNNFKIFKKSAHYKYF